MPKATRPIVARQPASDPTTIHYQVGIASLHAHTFAVTLRITSPVATQRVSLPAWIPGSYLVRDFARHLSGLQARQGKAPLAVRQLDKNSWEVDCKAGKALELRYEVYAFDNSVRCCWLDPQRGFFNGTGLLLQVAGQTQAVHELQLLPIKAAPKWKVATGLTPHKINTHGFGTYRAADYDELVDCPVELSDFWQGEFKACGVPHQMVVTGAPPSFDGERLLADCRRICETEIRFWSPDKKMGKQAKVPHHRYVFMLNVVDDGYGGLEHRNSTALICARRDLPRLDQPKAPEGYTTLQGLISHEYFHTWNVKRLRPSEFASFDYTRENYTELLWFFEGFTSYYDDLILRRAGLLDDAGYLKLLGKTINQVLQTPGQAVQSVAQSSFDAWLKYYRVDENTPNITVSYYTKGALVALCLDLTLRTDSKSATGVNLDAVMRSLWKRCKGGPMAEADVLAVLEEISGRSFAAELAAWVHGTKPLPLQALLQAHGLRVVQDPPALAQQLGLRVTESAGVVTIKNVLSDSLAERAGLAAGDEWIGVDDWRMTKLDDLPLYAGRAQQVTALVARDRQLVRLRLNLPKQAQAASWRLTVTDATKVAAWLDDKPLL